MFLKNDFVTINENLSIPENLKVNITNGQKILLLDNAFIFSKSPWSVIGDKNRKVTIGGKKENLGGGLIIKDSKKNSYFKNVKFEFLNGLKQNNISLNDFNLTGSINEFNLMGSINFYNTKTILENILFEKISSEDAINIISSEFYINNINFNKNTFDSIDFDFSNGTIENANFFNIGNDAIDFSGSNVKLNNASFYDIKDKVISVGENSHINISTIDAKKSFVGIASKDGSKVLAENIVMEDVKIPFLSFVKKSEYDEPSLFLKNIQVSNFLEKWITDEKSSIHFNNIRVGKVNKDIIPIVYEKNIELIK